MDAGFLIGTFLCGLAPTYTTLVLARVLTGAFGGILGGLALAIIGDVFPEERRGRATGALMSGFALASVAGVPFGLYLGTHFGWHVPFILLGILGCPVWAIAAWTLPPIRDHLVKATKTHPLRVVFETFTHSNHLNAFALIVMLMVAAFTIFPYLSPFLVSNIGMTEDQLGLVYIAGGVGDAVFRAADRLAVGSLRQAADVPHRHAPFGRVHAGRGKPGAGAGGRGSRHHGGTDGLQHRPDGGRDGDDHRQRRAAPPRRFLSATRRCNTSRSASGRTWAA